MNKSAAFKTALVEAKAQVDNVGQIMEIIEPNDIVSKAMAFKEIQAQIETLQAQLDELKENIIAEMNGEQEVTTDLFTIKYTTVVRNILDTQKFKSDYQDIYNAYLKENESKRFSISA
jgi:predicted phage-related endonuclease